jgi:HPt (histidine-containing phosphotransfer) domain-containing protein
MIEKDLLATEEAIVDQPQDLKEMITEAIVDQPQDLKEMITEATVDQPQDLKEMITEATVDQPQDLKEMITEAHTVKKVVNPLSSKRNLEVSKRNLSKNQQRNPLFNLNNFCH